MSNLKHLHAKVFPWARPALLSRWPCFQVSSVFWQFIVWKILPLSPECWSVGCLVGQSSYYFHHYYFIALVYLQWASVGAGRPYGSVLIVVLTALAQLKLNGKIFTTLSQESLDDLDWDTIYVATVLQKDQSLVNKVYTMVWVRANKSNICTQVLQH